VHVQSFPPIVDSGSKMLILGSMPGVASLRAHQYYWNPRNYMWRILYGLFGDGLEPDEEYENRISFAIRSGIALWDVIASCEREGSLDSNIKLAVPNDIPGLLERYPNIAVLVCNGTKSYSELNKHFGKHPELLKRKIVRMPSTSPIPTRDYRGLEDRLEAWRAITSLDVGART
jgi:hypoxanthine-DNA glycosylase